MRSDLGGRRDAGFGSVKDRLGRKRSAERSRGDSPSYRRPRVDARDRLNRRRGGSDLDPNRVMDREELESRRPDIKPWDLNPEFVPKGPSYFEHDDREGDEDDNRGGFRSGGGGRGFQRGGGGSFRGGRDRGRPRGGGFGSWRGRYEDRYDDNRSRVPDRGRSPFEWKHDRFEEVNQGDE